MRYKLLTKLCKKRGYPAKADNPVSYSALTNIKTLFNHQSPELNV